jgi:carboxymethylenebutenolidase
MPGQTADLQTEHLNYPGETGEVRAYFAKPKGDEKRPGVIVIHENQGLAPHIEDVNRRMAAEGFLALAPDSLTGQGGTPQDLDQAIEMIKQLDGRTTLNNYLAAVQYLKTRPDSTGQVGVIGFCWGGRMANLMAVNSPELSAAVPFYGAQPPVEDVPKIKASMLLHYAGLDEKINAGIPAYEAALKQAGIDYQIYMYEGAKHAFHNDAKADRYHPGAAPLAWQRTISFLNEKLKP